MKDTIVRIKNSILRALYQTILKKIFFAFDPEEVHDTMTHVGIILGKHAITRALTKKMFAYADPVLEQTVAGIHFTNPVGLAAGFDKDALLVDIIGAVGFGFTEVGSITGKECLGNARPRLWRMKNSKGLVVYYGLKNAGCDVIAKRLSGKQIGIPLGTSIAMTNDKTTSTREAGIADYVKAFKAFATIGDYFTINISCPNTCMGEPFVKPDALDALLTEIDAIPTSKPIFLKLSADLSETEINIIINVVNNHHVQGFVCTNLTKNRDSGHIKDEGIPVYGGMSGRLVKDRSDTMISYIYKKTQGAYIIIGCGGVSSAQDAYEKICRGASLVQLITGMIFEGPQLIGEINQGLKELLMRDGFATITEAIGSKQKSIR